MGSLRVDSVKYTLVSNCTTSDFQMIMVASLDSLGPCFFLLETQFNIAMSR